MFIVSIVFILSEQKKKINSNKKTCKIGIGIYVEL